VKGKDQKHFQAERTPLCCSKMWQNEQMESFHEFAELECALDRGDGRAYLRPAVCFRPADPAPRRLALCSIGDAKESAAAPRRRAIGRPTPFI
jgi:hypothetical protein